MLQIEYSLENAIFLYFLILQILKYKYNIIVGSLFRALRDIYREYNRKHSTAVEIRKTVSTPSRWWSQIVSKTFWDDGL